MKLESNAMYITSKFRFGNVILFGKKRKGKDLIFQKVIYSRRRSDYYANIPYGYKHNEIALSEISLKPNTYHDLINGKIHKLIKDHKREKRDIYISDGGNYLPSQFNHLLNKAYPSMSLYYSLSGHLYDSNVHVNYNGSFSRLWDKLREQADDYFRALQTVKLFFALYVRVRHYEEMQSAQQNVLPFKMSLLNGGNTRALKKQHDATYGKIRDMWIRVPKKIIKYDTRHFEKIFFTKESLVKPIKIKLIDKNKPKVKQVL